MKLLIVFALEVFFVQSVLNPTGIIIDGHSFEVEAQPLLDPTYVISSPNEMTWVQATSLVLIAHDYLAGKDIASLSIGDRVVLLLDSGTTISYQVTAVEWFTATNPDSPFSSFVDAHGYLWTSTTLRRVMYDTPGRMVLQTCFDDGKGRMFVLLKEV